MLVMALSNQGQLLGEPRQITALGERIQGVQWTADSRDLIFRNGPLDNSTLWRVSLEGRVPSRITSISQPASALAIAANVWKLAYGVDLSDDNIDRLDQPAARRSVVLGTGTDEAANPSPDGKSIVFRTSRTGRQQIWLAGCGGKNPREVTTVSGTDGVGAGWTPVGRDLLISVRSPRGNSIFRTPTVRLPLPGGRFLYYSHRHEGEGLFRQPANQSTPAPERVGTKPGLYFLRYGSKDPGLLQPFDHPIGWGLKLSSDEKSLLFTRTDSDNDDIHLIHSFR